MGPRCPHCKSVHEWTRGEIEEFITAPKVYFCAECHELFVVSIEELEELQSKLKPLL